jgi:hypothetical protein
MSFLVDLRESAGNLVPATLPGIAADGSAIWIALPTVNPGDDDDEDEDEDRGNIDPDEDEGVDDDEEDDEDDPLWATFEGGSGISRHLLRRNIFSIRRPSYWRHTARPACRVAI